MGRAAVPAGPVDDGLHVGSLAQQRRKFAQLHCRAAAFASQADHSQAGLRISHLEQLITERLDLGGDTIQEGGETLSRVVSRFGEGLGCGRRGTIDFNGRGIAEGRVKRLFRSRVVRVKRSRGFLAWFSGNKVLRCNWHHLFNDLLLTNGVAFATVLRAFLPSRSININWWAAHAPHGWLR